jgi:hypothetical protein
MALHRVRSKTEPAYESIASDEWLERWPDDFDVIDDEPTDRRTAASRRPDTGALPTIAPTDPDSDYR